MRGVTPTIRTKNLSKTQVKYQTAAKDALTHVGIVLTPEEQQNIEIADMGLGEFESTGLIVVTYINNEYYCAKELVLLPGQTCPQHKHPAIPSLN